MLVKYRNSQNKIALGLLSLMLKERDTKQLQQTMQRYEQNPDMEIYLWKEEEKYIGIIGIEVQAKEIILGMWQCCLPLEEKVLVEQW